MNRLSRCALPFFLLFASTSSVAWDPGGNYMCGVGTIAEIVEGGYSDVGMHFVVDWEGAPPTHEQLEGGEQNTARIMLSDVGPDKMRVLRGLSWLAFANNFKVQFVTNADTPGGQPDCSKIRELHVLR